MPAYEVSHGGVRQVAELTLRGPDGPFRVHAYRPTAPAGCAPVLVLFAPDQCLDPLSRLLSANITAVVLALPIRSPDLVGSALDRASAVTLWVADHGAELDADPRQLVVAGAAHGAVIALAVTALALQDGWPPIQWQVFVDPSSDHGGRDSIAALARTAGDADLPPMTVISGFPGLPPADPGFADLLRRAGAVVAEIRLDPGSIPTAPD